jgi:hypothetical protein
MSPAVQVVKTAEPMVGFCRPNDEMSDLYDQAVGSSATRGGIHGDTAQSKGNKDKQARIKPEQQERVIKRKT